MSKKYISVADTAKLVRKALATNFPGQVFSVRSKSYSGGASITVRWVDGPTTKEVDEVVKPFSGASFDGMIDLKSYHDSIHPETGETVHYGADYVFTEREYSRELLEKACQKFEAEWGMEPAKINAHSSGGAYLIEDNRPIRGGHHYQTVAWETNRIAQDISAYIKPAPKLENLPLAPMISPNSPSRSIDAPTAKAPIKVEKFKGHDVIAIPLGNGEEFRFGKAKAQALLAYIEEIKQFANG